MALPTVEFVVAPATDAFRANPREPALTDPIQEIMKSCQGMIKSTFGVEHEDNSWAYIAVIWHSLADHKALMNDPVKYKKVGEALEAILNPKAISMFHCAFNSEPYKALEAPVTEIVTYTLNEGADKETLEELVDELTKVTNDAPPDSGMVSAAWGPSVEKDDVLFLIIGWTSIEAHHASVKAWPEMQAIISKIKALAKIDVKYVALA